ncbi:MAG: MbtH family NRPS accessory protein [Deltaproteobacteria bacterium]|nr:MAG: MbtH family NRPS accessory protein [Deltaproteobacteria bacterium]
MYGLPLSHEDQYSIWPVGRDIPLGWRTTGTRGTRATCLIYIAETWTDMRPLSLRRNMPPST